ncbi:MAG: ribokinase [Pseudomonadota bacterium]
MIWNLGSINTDNLYTVPHLPVPGETLAARELQRGLGGKGANMSVAAARGAAHVVHIGAIGADGVWAKDRLLEYGVDTRHIAEMKDPTGHANITLDPHGENQIILYPGANHKITPQMIGSALAEASPRDFLLMQNETTGQLFAAQTARTLGLRVAYAAAPFEARAVRELMAHLDLLIMNAVEAAQLEAELGQTLASVTVSDVIVTRGADGCRWLSQRDGQTRDFAAYPIDVVDTTGAGDTFTGYLLAGLDRGLRMEGAIDLALQAAALMVGRRGTADVIPDLKEIQDHGFG